MSTPFSIVRKSFNTDLPYKKDSRFKADKSQTLRHKWNSPNLRLHYDANDKSYYNILLMKDNIKVFCVDVDNIGVNGMSAFAQELQGYFDGENSEGISYYYEDIVFTDKNTNKTLDGLHFYILLSDEQLTNKLEDIKIREVDLIYNCRTPLVIAGGSKYFYTDGANKEYLMNNGTLGDPDDTPILPELNEDLLRILRKYNEKKTVPSSPKLSDVLNRENPNDLDYDEWFNMMAVVFNSVENKTEGLTLFLEWSRQSSKHDEDTTVKKWDSLDENRPHKRTLNTLLKQKQRDGLEKEPERFVSPTRAMYLSMKADFEKTTFKVKFPICFVDMDPEDNNKVYFKSEQQIVQTYRNKKLPISDEKFVKEWLDDPDILTYSTTDFLPPPLKTSKAVFNMWRGFRYGNCKPKEYDAGNVQFLLDTVKTVLKSEEAYDYYMNCVAHKIQYPGKKLKVARILYSETQGSGKNSIVNFEASLYGNEFIFETSDSEKIFNKFNSFRQNKLLIVVDETSGKNNYFNRDLLKDMVTDDSFEMERKGLEVMKQRSLADFVFTTNNNNAMCVEKTDRRFTIFHCSTELVGRYDHWNRFYSLLDDEATMYGLFQYFKNYEVKVHNFQSCRPTCQLYKELQQANTKSEILFLLDVLNDSQGEDRLVVSIDRTLITLRGEEVNGELRVKSSILFDTYKKWLVDRGFDFKINITRFGLNMKMMTEDKPEGLKGLGHRAPRNVTYYSIDREALRKELTDKGYC